MNATATALRGRRVCIAGLGVTGSSVVRVLTDLGADIVTADRRDGTDQRLPDGVDLVVTSPGWRPDQPLLVAAAAAGVPVWGDVELAWRLRPEGQEWLGVTGTNGKTTTVAMLESILLAAGVRAVACGNIGLAVLDAVLHEPAYDVLAVEMSSFQLHWTHTVEFISGALLNIAPDHLDWHGSLAAYAEDKAKIWRSDWYAVYNADDPLVVDLAERIQDRQDFSIDPSRRACFGVAGDVLVDRCIGWEPGEVVQHTGGGIALARLADIPAAGPHNVANALAAAALARALTSATGSRFRVLPDHVRDGLRAFRLGAHRIARVASFAGVDYVDDSKATNPHAASASLQAFPSVVWVAGGLAKGATFDDVVARNAVRLRGVVLMGADRALIAEALARHAPDVPVVDVTRTDTGAMDDVVRAAAGFARPGDTVLLAPACASMDMFRDYAARGDAFAAAARALSPDGSGGRTA